MGGFHFMLLGVIKQKQKREAFLNWFNTFYDNFPPREDFFDDLYKSYLNSVPITLRVGRNQFAKAVMTLLSEQKNIIFSKFLCKKRVVYYIGTLADAETKASFTPKK